MFDEVKKFILPEPVITAIRDAVVDKLSQGLDGKNRERVLMFRSDGKFRNELNAALERAVFRFAEEYEDQLFIDAVVRNTDFWSLKSVQEAVKKIVIRPSSYLESEFKTLRQSFAEVVSNVPSERVDAAVQAFLRCVADEVMNISQLAPIYQVQLEKISVQQGREMIGLFKDLNEMQRRGLLAPLEVSAQQNRLLLIGTSELAQPDESSLQELKVKYFESILQKYEYMDMGGISPRVTSKAESRIVSIRMEDVFIPLKAKDERLKVVVKRNKFEDVQMALNVGPDNKLEVADWGVPIKAQAEIQGITTSHFSQSKDQIVGIGKILDNRKVVILGHPGAGKTTIGKFITYMIAAQKKLDLIGEHLRQYIPVVVKAAEYGKFLNKDNGLSFYSYITGKLHTDDYGPLFAWALKRKQCLVIIDGLDEVPDATLRVRVATKIEQFVSDYWENQFLVTSRIVGYQGNQLTGDFAHFTLEELEKDQIIEFLKNWYMAVTGKKSNSIEKECKRRAQELWKSIEASEGVKKLAGTPLLLTIIALVNYYGSKLPDRRVELYQLATETLLSNWPLKQREQKIDWKEILAVLEPIAYYIFTTSEDRLITEYEFRPLFEQQVCKFWGTDARKTRNISNKLLDKIEQHTGFFLKRGTNEQGQEVYGFLHPTFAEYLTARYLAQRWVEKHELEFENTVHEAAWHEVILLMAGHLGMLMDVLATRLVEKIENLASLYEDYLHRDLLLAAEIIGDNVPISREKRDAIVSRLISTAIETPYMTLWNRILYLLGDIAAAFPFVSQPSQLKSQEVDTIARQLRKVLISRKIGVYKQQEGLETIIESLFADKESKRLAMSAIESSFNNLNMISNHDSAMHVLIINKIYSRLFIVPKRMVGQITRLNVPIGDVSAFMKVGRVSRGDLEQVWLLDVQQLLQLGASKLASVLFFFDSESEDERPYLLLRILDAEQSFLLIFEEWLSHAVSKSPEEDRQVIFKALEALLHYSYSMDRFVKRVRTSPKIAEWRSILQSFLIACDKPEFFLVALELLLMLTPNQEDHTEILLQGLNYPDSEVRAKTASMIIGDKVSEPVLNKLWDLLMDSSINVRIASAHSILWIGKFKEKDIALLSSIIFGEKIAYTPVTNLLSAISNLILLSSKAKTTESLSTISNLLKTIIESLDEDARPLVRVHWYRPSNDVLIELSKVLVSLFGSNDPKIRCCAINIWANFRFNLRPKTQLPPQLEATSILPLLRDSDVTVKLAAIKALELRDFSTLDVIDSLNNALYSDDTQVKVAAIRALHSSNISRPEIIDRLLEMLREDVLEVAKEAASTLSVVKDSEMRQRVVNEAERLIANPLKGKYVYDILWNLLVATKINKSIFRLNLGWEEL